MSGCMHAMQNFNLSFYQEDDEFSMCALLKSE